MKPLSLLTKVRRLFVYSSVGLVMPLMILLATSLEMKWCITILGAMLGACIVLPIPNKKEFFIGVLIFSMCVNLDVTLFIVPLSESYVLTSYGLSISFAQIVMIILYLLWILEGFERAFLFSKTKVFYVVFAFLVVFIQLLSFVNSEIILVSLYEFLKHVFALMFFFYFVYHLKSERIMKFVLVCLFAGVILSTTVSIVQYISGESLGLEILGESRDMFNQRVVDSTQFIKRASGLMGHANMLAMYMILLGPIALSLSLSNVSQRLKIFAFISTVFVFLGLLLTFSRGGILGLSFGLFVWVLARRRELFKVYNKSLVLLYSLCSLPVIGFFGYKLIMRFFATPSDQVSVRFILNDMALQMIARHPFVGVGLNNFAVQFPNYNTDALYPWLWYPVHNYYLLVASETGLISLIVFLCFVGFVIKEAFFVNKHGKSEVYKNLVMGAACGIISSLLHCFVDYPLRVSPMYTNFFLMIALIIVIRSDYIWRVDE